MKAIALIEAPQHVCYRYRLEAYVPELNRRGWTLEAVPISPGAVARLRQLRSVATADVVILQRKLLPIWQLLVLRRQARALVYDFDDAMFHRDSYSPKGVHSRRRLMQFWATIYAADAVIAGSEYLAAQAARFVGADRVTTIPTSLHPATYPLARHPDDGVTKLVWIGQPSTLNGLQLMQAQLTAVAQRVASVELHVVCSEFPQFAGVKVVARRWSSQTEAQELAGCDVGISWLPDDPWSAGKCGLKLLQYMAAGLPVVANSVGMHRQLVRHGETGFLADTPAEWIAAIGRLAEDPALRRRMGAAGRELVEDHYNVDRWSGVFASLLQGAAGPPRLPEFAPPAPLGKLRQRAVPPPAKSGDRRW